MVDDSDSITIPVDANSESLDDNDKNNTTDLPSHQPLHIPRETVPVYAQLLIDSLKYNTTPDVIPFKLTEEEYRGKLKAWDEATSTLPMSNMHLGHLKAYWAEHTLPEGSTEVIKLDKTRRHILDGHLALYNYALHFGYSFDQSKQIVNTLLEKDKGLPKIH